MLVGPKDKRLAKVSRPVKFPLDEEAKQAIFRLTEYLDRNRVAAGIVDVMSAPLLGDNLRIIGIQQGIVFNHPLHTDQDIIDDDHGRNIIIMLNPTIEKEPNAVDSWQYELNQLEDAEDPRAYLVKRNDAVIIKFDRIDIFGQQTEQKLILGLWESRIVKQHIMWLDGHDPFVVRH